MYWETMIFPPGFIFHIWTMSVQSLRERPHCWNWVKILILSHHLRWTHFQFFKSPFVNSNLTICIQGGIDFIFKSRNRSWLKVAFTLSQIALLTQVLEEGGPALRTVAWVDCNVCTWGHPPNTPVIDEACIETPSTANPAVWTSSRSTPWLCLRNCCQFSLARSAPSTTCNINQNYWFQKW